MEGGYVGVRRQSILTADESAIPLATTQKALWLPAKTMFPAGFWAPMKVVGIEVFGKATSDGTAANYVFGVGLGAGDAPAAIVTGATVAGTVSQTNVTWRAQIFAQCRTFGAAGVLRLWGEIRPVVALLASTLQPYIMPNATPADITFDFTANTNALTLQAQRSGAGVWTMTTTGLFLLDFT